MSSPFGSLENPFAPSKRRSKDDAALVGKILGPHQEAAMREILGSPPPDESDPFDLSVPESSELSPLEQLELTYSLSEQHEKQRTSLKAQDLLETNESGIEFIRGIDGYEYPYPTVEDIAAKLIERQAELAIKAEQGFTKLLIVPFAVSLDRQIEGLRQTLLEYKKKHPDFTLDTLNENSPISVWNEEVTRGYKNADVNGNLVYGVKAFDKDPAKHQGLTKAQILKTERNARGPLAGWRIELFQADRKTRGIRGIPRDGEGRVDGRAHPRPEIETGNGTNEYLAGQLPGESGMTPEDWIAAFIFHLQETGKPLDDYQNGEEATAFLTGAWFKTFGVVPNASWYGGVRRVYLDVNNPYFSDPDYGSRFVVRV